jgi:hypothetical protein
MREIGKARRLVVLACLVSASLAVSASAQAAVTIGQTGEPTDGCSAGFEYAQLTVTSGNSYFVPALPPATALTITSWTHVAYPDPGQRLKLRVYRPVPGTTSTFTVLAEDVHDVTSGGLNTFASNIPVQAGDTIGITEVARPGAPLFACGFGPGGETAYSDGPEKPIGSQVTFSGGSGFRLNVSAVVEPTNAFSSRQTRNKKKGTAKLILDVPNPGEATVSGKGAKVSAAKTKTAAAAGPVKFKIRAKGKKLAKLNRSGKVKLTATITYTPTAGSPSTRSVKVKLKKT